MQSVLPTVAAVKRSWTLSPWLYFLGQEGPIQVSTIVLLTGTVPNPTLHEIEHCPTYQDGRKLIETVGRGGMY
jgi:hypothetical protein